MHKAGNAAFQHDFEGAASVKLKLTIVDRSQHNGVLSLILSKLSDGNKTNLLVAE